MCDFKTLTDQQWQQIEVLFPKPVKRGRGKPHTPWRRIVNSILVVLCSKRKWDGIPQTDDFATKSAAHRWFVLWDKSGFLKHIIEVYRVSCEYEVEILTVSRRNRLPKSDRVLLPLDREEEPLPLREDEMSVGFSLPLIPRPKITV